MRARAMAGLGVLGIELAHRASCHRHGTAIIAAELVLVWVLVIPTSEEYEIAEQTASLIAP